MNNKNLYAVITGDLVESSRLTSEKREHLLDVLRKSFRLIDEISGKKLITAPFEIYRGDSFQGVLNDPSDALLASMIIRATLRKSFETKKRYAWDARISAGIGTIEFFSEKTSEGDGVAYRNSGPQLDEMKTDTRLRITTPDKELNDELEVECSLLDAVVSGWSIPQAEVVLKQMHGLTQQQTADELGISQSAVNHRLKGAGWSAMSKFMKRFKHMISKQYLYN